MTTTIIIQIVIAIIFAGVRTCKTLGSHLLSVETSTSRWTTCQPHNQVVISLSTYSKNYATLSVYTLNRRIPGIAKTR